jgi:tight adherence protein C
MQGAIQPLLESRRLSDQFSVKGESMLSQLGLTKDFLPVAAGALAFFGVLFLVIGLALPGRRNPLDKRLQELPNSQLTLDEIEMQAPFTERFLRPLTSQLARVFTRFTPTAGLDNTERQLQLAGQSGRMTVADFLGIRGLVTILGLFLGGGAALVLGQAAFGFILFLLIGGSLGYLLPTLWLRQQITQRRTGIQRALPDAIDLLTISVEAGLGFDQALVRVIRKSHTALTTEFSRVLYEMQFGVTRRDALRNMVDRCGLEDLNLVVAAIIQAEQLGASLANVLRVQAEEMRVRRRQHAERLIHLAPIKMLFPIAFLIFPPVFIVVLGPAIPGIIHTFDPTFPL